MDQHATTSDAVPADVDISTPGGATPPSKKRRARRIAMASLAGGLIETYDFAIFGTAAALVFPKIFFPALGEAAGTVASLLTFGVAFLARPIGSILFGHYGDRLGRKKTLVATLLLMGIATIAVGVVPSADSIGVAAPIILVILRFAQGISSGGEWAGATLFVTEHAPPGKRGLYAMFPQFGITIAYPLGSATFLLTGALMSEETFLSWGWRVPFIGSSVLILVGLYMRLKIEETPVFNKERSHSGTSTVPFLDAIKAQPGTIAVASGVALTALTFVYLSAAYLPSYGTSVLELSYNEVLVAGVIAGSFFGVGVVVGALGSDSVGRRPVIGGASLLGFIWAAFVMPSVLGTHSEAALVFAMSVTMLIGGMVYGPVGAFLPELFRTRYRYTATALTYNLTAVVSAAASVLAPIVVESHGVRGLGFVVGGLSLIAVICTFSLKETRDLAMDNVSDEGTR